MARLAVRRTRSPESSDDEDTNSRSRTPLSTAANDRKRARRSTNNNSVDDDSDSSISEMPTSTQQSIFRMSQKLSAPQAIQYLHHQPGAIVRVKLENFVTYSRAEFFPGPSLNMVIGPNGTGKSTLVCAICLGLGWSTGVLGRSNKVGDYVKTGCEEAVIEIELKGTLKNGRVRNHVIKRRIRKDAHSKDGSGSKTEWWINNQSQTEKSVRIHAQKQNIQIDNLCQFLPQDRVSEFASMTPRDLLKSTQQAAGDGNMTEWYETLIKLRDVQKNELIEQRRAKEELQDSTRRQEMQQAEVERLRDREKHKEKLAWLESTKLIPEFFTAKIATEEAKTKQRTLEQELTELQKQAAPTLREVNAKQRYRHDVQNLVQSRTQELDAAQKRSTEVAGEVDELHAKIEHIGNRIDGDKGMITTKRAQVDKLRKTISELENELKEPEPAFDSRTINTQIKDREREINDLADNVRDAKDRGNDLKRQKDSREKALTEKERNISNFDTTAGQREQRLEAINRDAAKAWKWIQGHQNIFDKPVLGPPAVVCTVPDLSMASAVESTLQKSDLCLITAQTPADYRRLQDKLVKEQKLNVGLRVRPNDSMEARPYSAEELAAFGLDSYIIDHIDGPSTVLAMLCDEKKLHLSCIAKGKVSDEQHSRLTNSRISTYFTGNTVHRITRRAGFGPDSTISTTSFAKAAVVWTDRPVDLGRKAALQREVAELKGELEEIQTGLGECKTTIDEAASKTADLKQEIKDLEKEKVKKQKEIVDYRKLPGMLKDRERQRDEHLGWLASAKDRRLAWAKEREDIMLKRAEQTIKYAETVGGIKEALAALIEAEVQLVEATSDFETLEERNRAIRDMVKSKTIEEQQAREVARTMGKKIKTLLQAVQVIRLEADQLHRNGNPGLMNLIQTMITDKWTPDTYDIEVDSVNAQIALTEGGNADTIRQYEERQKRIAQLQTSLVEYEEKVANSLAAIKEVRNNWEPALEALVAKISDAFADHFDNIGCAGCVEVGKAHSTSPEDCVEELGGEDNGLDFANWAINIKVKFRETEPLTLLDNHRQSGGERAVSTVFYLMALQSLSRAPFRVVDEINQGMDGRNERMVHGRMVNVATAERVDGRSGGGSQYFLITPKLLTGLTYKEGMTVLCIVSGEHVPAEGQAPAEEDGETPFSKFPRLDFGAFARQNNARKGMGGGRRVDSGIAMVGPVSG